MEIKRSEKHKYARNALPNGLKPIFDEFVEHYKFAGLMRYGKPFISYIILADMVRAGWRLAAEPIEE